jgi:hypothetical protein
VRVGGACGSPEYSAIAVCAGVLPLPAQTFIGLAARSEYRARRGSPLLVQSPRFAVGPFSPAVRSVPRRPARAKVKHRPQHPLFEFGLRPRYCPTIPSHAGRSQPAPPMSFAALQHIRPGRSTATGFACPLRSTLRVWRPSRWFTPFTALPALFRAGGTPGLHPSEPDSPRRFPARCRPGGPTYRFCAALR